MAATPPAGPAGAGLFFLVMRVPPLKRADDGPASLHRRIDDELQRRIVIGLKRRVLEAERTLLGMAQQLPAGHDAADVVRLPPRRELGAALPKTRQQIEKSGIGSPKIMRGAKLG